MNKKFISRQCLISLRGKLARGPSISSKCLLGTRHIGIAAATAADKVSGCAARSRQQCRLAAGPPLMLLEKHQMEAFQQVCIAAC